MSRGFTLIEMLVVIGIIGIIAAIGLPAMKGIGQANLTAAANRQMLDDLGYARLRAISDRTKVFVVFVPPKVYERTQVLTDTRSKRVGTNLITAQYTGYAVVALRSVGDQPGQIHPRYLTDWKRLPEGIVIATNKFSTAVKDRITANEYLRAFPRITSEVLPFPTSRDLDAVTSPNRFSLPYIGFNAQGQLLSGRDEVIPLARASLFNASDSNGRPLPVVPDVQMIPPGNSLTNMQFIRINWLTGRAKVEAPDFRP